MSLTIALIFSLFFCLGAATPVKKYAQIESSACALYYTIDSSTFTFDKCSIYEQGTFVSWNQCVDICCPVMPQGVFSVASLSTIKLCQAYNQSGLSDIVRIIIIVLGIVFAVMILICLGLIFASIYKAFKYIKVNHENKSKETITTVEWEDQININNLIDQLVWSNNKKQQMKNKVGSQCSICLEDNTEAQLFCGHRFHSGCIGSWFKKSTACPCCRRDDIRGVKVYCTKCWTNYLVCSRILMSEHGSQVKQYCQNCNLGLVTRGSVQNLTNGKELTNQFENHSKLMLDLQLYQYI